MKRFLFHLLLVVMLVVLVELAQGVVWSAEPTSFMLSWPANPEMNIQRYVIYRSTNPDTANLLAFAPLDSVGSSTLSWTDNSVVKGTRYFYRMRARTTDGRYSRLSRVISGKVLPQGSTSDECRIVSKDRQAENFYRVGWTSHSPTNGFTQYGISDFGSSSSWIGGALTTHEAWLAALSVPALYQVRAVAYDIHGDWSMTVSPCDTFSTFKTTTDAGGIPPVTVLYSTRPNPFNPTTTISYSLAVMGPVSIRLYDTAGRLMRVLVDGVRTGGAHDVLWNGKDSAGKACASGVYLCRLQAGAFDQTKKLVLLR